MAGQRVRITQPGAAAWEYSIAPLVRESGQERHHHRRKCRDRMGMRMNGAAAGRLVVDRGGRIGRGKRCRACRGEKLTGAPRDRVGTVTIAGKTVTVTQVK